MIVWALFDSETATVAKALPECEVYSFGIGSGTEHIHMDLSDFETARKELERYPRPDVIFASPPCESWVDVSKGNLRFYTSENGWSLHWKEKWIPFDLKPKFAATRLNGIATATTLAKIIQHFKPMHWAIENGRRSWLFDWLKEKENLQGFRNNCNYFCYGFDVLKPTIIYSNANLCLGNLRPRGKMLKRITRCNYIHKHKNAGSVKYDGVKEYSARSMVPPLLYIDIMRQFAHGGQKTLFPLEESA